MSDDTISDIFTIMLFAGAVASMVVGAALSDAGKKWASTATVGVVLTLIALFNSATS